MAKKLTFDRVLFTLVILLLVSGLVMVYSASAAAGMRGEDLGPLPPLVKQLLAAILGLGLMGAAMFLDYRHLRRPLVLYGLLGGVLVLLVVVLFAPLRNETHRWLFVAGVSVQPSELAKLVLVFFLAYQIDRKADRINQLSFLVPSVCLPVLLAFLVFLQPDYGTAGILVLSTVLLLFLAGVAWRYLVAAGLVLLPALWFLILAAPYRWKRFLAFLEPEADPLGSGFQVLQSLIAVGSGGLWGLGLGQSVQKLHFVPMAESDFIFSILCEELGLVGGLGALLLFALLVWRGIRAGIRAPDNLGRFLAWGLTQTVALQALINVSVVLGLVPVTGTPLPFFSFGGSSLVTTLLACGVLLNVSQHG